MIEIRRTKKNSVIDDMISLLHTSTVFIRSLSHQRNNIVERLRMSKLVQFVWCKHEGNFHCLCIVCTYFYTSSRRNLTFIDITHNIHFNLARKVIFLQRSWRRKVKRRSGWHNMNCWMNCIHWIGRISSKRRKTSEWIVPRMPWTWMTSEGMEGITTVTVPTVPTESSVARVASKSSISGVSPISRVSTVSSIPSVRGIDHISLTAAWNESSLWVHLHILWIRSIWVTFVRVDIPWNSRTGSPRGQFISITIVDSIE